MKRFHELTPDQQKSAIAFTDRKLRELLAEGVLLGVTSLSEEEINNYAQAGAEDALYSEPTDIIIADIAE
jgi:hypothetical protein